MFGSKKFLFAVLFFCLWVFSPRTGMAAITMGDTSVASVPTPEQTATTNPGGADPNLAGMWYFQNGSNKDVQFFIFLDNGTFFYYDSDVFSRNTIGTYSALNGRIHLTKMVGFRTSSHLDFSNIFDETSMSDAELEYSIGEKDGILILYTSRIIGLGGVIEFKKSNGMVYNLVIEQISLIEGLIE